ncbi:cupin domain-containing protein [Helicobacter sp.]|uniref:cupin domain-containing protein n=1 Tax=Helicobacter sp. TaxID=218 RepID=UPI00199B9A0C|nr:cupin domain-containing protein [Helicobacter sp.]MBD5164948.1 cupin domain-containing protein [Helicobacter sp.]
MKNAIQNLSIKNCETLLDAISKIETNKIKAVFVADKNNKIIGCLVDGDIRRWLLKNPDKLPNKEIISQHFTFNNFTYILKDNFNFDNLASLFEDKKIDIIPILDENRLLFNFITRTNFHFLLLNNIALKPHFKPFLSKEMMHQISSRPWGFYKSILLTKNVQSKLITLFPYQMISLQKHKRREEHWIIVYGRGKIVLEDSSIDAYAGKYIFIPKGCKHRIINTGTKNLVFCEVQLGDYFGEDDIIRYEDKYNRR